MCKIPFRSWIANAAARFSGRRGSVTTQARQADCSRQTVYDHAQKVEAAVEAEHGGGATHEEKDREIAVLRQENAQLWDWLDQTIDLLRPSNRCSPPRAWAWGSATAKSTTCWPFSSGPWPVPVARRFIAGSRPREKPPVRSSSDWMAAAGCWCWSAVSTRSSSTADRSWWGSIPKAWCGFWGKKRPITKVRLGSENCSPGPRCVM